MNSLGADIIQLITQTLKPGGPGDAFDAFVITNDAQNFSVGANIMLLLMAVQEEEWDDVDMVIRQFQGMTQAIKFSPKPVVVGAFGLTLGGGRRSRCTPLLASRMPNSTRGWWKSEWACFPAAADARRCCCARSTARSRSVPMAAANRSRCWKR